MAPLVHVVGCVVLCVVGLWQELLVARFNVQ